MNTRFNVGDVVWFVRSGRNQRFVECPDCLGQCRLTVILGDGSQVGIDCQCCQVGWQGSLGRVAVYDWHCDVASAVISGMEINGEQVQYKSAHIYLDDVDAFATRDEAEAAMVKVLARHESEEAHRFAHVKDQNGRHHSWAWNVHYHRREAKECKRRMEYHESKLVVAKAKAKLPESAVH